MKRITDWLIIALLAAILAMRIWEWTHLRSLSYGGDLYAPPIATEQDA